MNYSNIDVKVELYNLLKRATILFLSTRQSNIDKNSDLPELLRKCNDSPSQELQIFSSVVNEYRDEINNKIEELDDDQLEHFATLIKYYKDGLKNVENYSTENQIEYFLSLPENLAIDIGKYTYQDEALVKKKSIAELSEEEVPETVTSFFL